MAAFTGALAVAPYASPSRQVVVAYSGAQKPRESSLVVPGLVVVLSLYVSGLFVEGSKMVTNASKEYVKPITE